MNATGQSDVQQRAGERSDSGERERSYPEHLREQIERHLQAMRFSEEALTAGLEEAMR